MICYLIRKVETSEYVKEVPAPYDEFTLDQFKAKKFDFRADAEDWLTRNVEDAFPEDFAIDEVVVL